jgi:hypothetical protein
MREEEKESLKKKKQKEKKRERGRSTRANCCMPPLRRGKEGLSQSF